MRFGSIFAAAAVLLTTIGAAEPTVVSNMSIAPIAIDHHLHVHAPEIVKFLPHMCNSPQMPEGCSPEFVKANTVEDLLAQLDAAHIRGGSLLSTAYLAETAFADPVDPDHASILHAGNAFTEAAARAHPDRLMAFISVNPITPTALPELARWKGDPFVTGVKLHLTNSGVDLRNPDHVRKLAEVFRAAAANHFAIVIHMRSERTDYGAQDVQTFLRDVLPAAGNTTVQIAHAAGWGGIDANTLSALGAFADALDARPSLRKHLYFDLAEVWDQDSSETDMEKLVVLIRRIGIKQFLPASDWPFSSDLATYYNQRYPRLPLSNEEWAVIRSNTAPYVPPRIK
ncbi:amidohydrolase family protein [Novosphingobium sp. PhB165]|uniref:amidohydrolase family protein n=1 Tax=Novosphingobium sp. PhB165 TaxID=2485105 RepID=UPI001404615B|nr:amidohydrolase family protein [Novosphingobium sp. PhB165]